MKLYLLHPVAVHFPIALLTAGFVFEAFRFKSPAPWLASAASWLLWAGTAAIWAAVGLGLLAERTVPHVPAAWEVLAEHEVLGFWAAGLFTGLSGWRIFWREKGRSILWAAWLVAVGVLFAAGYHGGELVFRYGVGVTPG